MQGILDAAQRGKIHRLSAAPELSPDEEGGELNVVPYLDVVMNILIFVLATIAVTFTASIDTTAPSAIGRGPADAGLNLTVLVVNDGFSLKTAAGNIATGCSAPGPGVTIPKRDGAYDYGALTACVAKLKHAAPEFERETQAFVSANPATEYQTVIRVIDALRSTPSGELLFSDIGFRVPR